MRTCRTTTTSSARHGDDLDVAEQAHARRRLMYSFDGSRGAFYEWLQRPVPRPG